MTGPDNDNAIIGHSYALLRAGRPGEALAELRGAVEDRPSSVALQLAIANVLLATRRVDDSIDCVQRVLAAHPGLATVRSNLANLLHRTGRLKEACAHYEKVIEDSPANVDANYRRGVVLRDLGNTQEAIAAFRKTVDIEPGFVKAWHAFVEATKDPLADAEVSALLDLQKTGVADMTDRIRLGFALGRHFERAGRVSEAAAQLLEANALQRSRLDYDIDNHLRAMRNIRECFDESFFDRWQDAGLSDEKPVFIIGMPRSGTTLVEQILAGHSQVFAAGEISLLVNAIIERFPIRNGTDYTTSLADASIDDMHRVARRYLEGLPATEAGRITDKLPHNFLNIGMIHVLFPRAAIVHCKRDPRDTCFSIFKHLFGSDAHAYAYDLHELARYHNGYSTMMQHWERMLPDRIHTVRYERLVQEQETETRELLNACGLDWEPACLDFYKVKRPVATISASQVRQPVYSGSVGAWKAYADMLEPLLAALD